jgi:hypothetical protein
MRPKTKITVSYRVIDTSGHTMEVIKRTGYNKQNLLWQANRFVKHKYGKEMKLHPYKIVEESV